MDKDSNSLIFCLVITVAYKKKQDEQDRKRHDDQDDELSMSSW